MILNIGDIKFTISKSPIGHLIGAELMRLINSHLKDNDRHCYNYVTYDNINNIKLQTFEQNIILQIRKQKLSKI